MCGRWREFFDQVLNKENERESVVSYIRMNREHVAAEEQQRKWE